MRQGFTFASRHSHVRIPTVHQHPPELPINAHTHPPAPTSTHQHPPAPTSTHIDTQLTQLTLCSNVMARRDPGDHAFRLIEGYLHREVLAPVCKLESTELGWTRQVVEQRKDR